MRIIPLRDRLPDVLAQDRMARQLGERRLAGSQLAAAGDVEPRQHADPFSVFAGTDGILQRRGGGGERSDAQHPDRHPGAGGKLESSANRPSNMMPFAGSAGSAKRTASPGL